MKLTKSYLKQVIKEELEQEAARKKKPTAEVPAENPDVYPDFASAVDAIESGEKDYAMFKDGKVSGLQLHGSVYKSGTDGKYVVRVIDPIEFKNKYYNATNPKDLSTWEKDPYMDKY